jgi:excisionase family DNA binding protein
VTARTDPSPRQNPSGEWLTAEEAARYLRLPSVKALYQRAARGQVPKYQLGARTIRFRRRDLDALLRAA